LISLNKFLFLFSNIRFVSGESGSITFISLVLEIIINYYTPNSGERGKKMVENEEFELVPMSPIRRLEKRLEKLEGAPGVDAREFFKELVSIIRMNQQLVDELAKANDALRIELSKLPGRLDKLITNIDELISFIKASAAEEAGGISGEALKPLLEKMDKLIEGNKKLVENNEAMVASLEELSKRLRRPAPVRRIRKPLLPVKPK